MLTVQILQKTSQTETQAKNNCKLIIIKKFKDKNIKKMMKNNPKDYKIFPYSKNKKNNKPPRKIYSFKVKKKL